jgi:hypothetical protein
MEMAYLIEPIQVLIQRKEHILIEEHPMMNMPDILKME